MAAATDDSGIPSFYTEEENVQKLCNFLRSNEGPPVRNALLLDKRVLYLKGQSSLSLGHGLLESIISQNRIFR